MQRFTILLTIASLVQLLLAMPTHGKQKISETFLKRFSEIDIYEIGFDNDGFIIYESGELVDRQIGYSIDPEGNSLTGEEKGSWERSWIVIGKQALTGDPLFIDTGSHVYPVYTAQHGMGEWDPDTVSSSIEHFEESLRKMVSYKKEVDDLLRKRDLEMLKSRIREMKEELNNLNPESWQWELLFDDLEENISDIEEFGWE